MKKMYRNKQGGNENPENIVARKNPVPGTFTERHQHIPIKFLKRVTAVIKAVEIIRLPDKHNRKGKQQRQNDIHLRNPAAGPDKMKNKEKKKGCYIGYSDVFNSGPEFYHFRRESSNFHGIPESINRRGKTGESEESNHTVSSILN
jgi:hypothetical protein